MAIAFPQIDPVLFSIGPISIKWYSIAYILGILVGYALLKRLNNYAKVISLKTFEDIIPYAVVGIVLGGRLGYVLFYEPYWIIDEPFRILKTWEGGMSFHGGMIGATIAMWLLCKRGQDNFLKAMGLIACVAPIGLFFGRIANFINAELYGRVTSMPWGIVFPATDGQPRHPSQIYEAFLEGLLLFAIMKWLFNRALKKHNYETLGGYFLIFYGFFRIVAEFFREPTVYFWFIGDAVTVGQLLSLPMVILGAYLVKRFS